MASFLESFGPALGTALKVAGTGLSQQAAQNFQRQTELSNARQHDSQKLVMGLLATAAANGQEGADQLLAQYTQKIGLPTPEGFQGIGPSAETKRFELEQEQVQDVSRRKDSLRQFASALSKDTDQFNHALAMEKAALALGLDEEAGNWGARAGRLKPPNQLMPKYVEIATGKKDPVTGKDLYETFEITRDPQTGKIVRQAISKPHVKGAATEVKTELKVDMRPPGESAQERVTQGQQMLQALDDIESVIDRSGLVEGWWSEVEAFLGTDPGSVQFKTATNNLKVLAQAIIVGIPSNFDVQTFISTIPSLTESEEVNKQRISFIRRNVKQIIVDTIAYHKGTKQEIPKEVRDRALNAAKLLGVDTAKIEAWDGRGDPMQKTLNMMQELEAQKPVVGTISQQGLQPGQIQTEEIPQIHSLEEWKDLPPGTTYLDPNGVQRTKGGQ